MSNFKRITRDITLANGHTIPAVHISPTPTSAQETYHFVLTALEFGYRAFQTFFQSSPTHNRSREVSLAISNWLAQDPTVRQRRDVFYCVTLDEAVNGGYEETTRTLRNVVEECGLGYVDSIVLDHRDEEGGTAKAREAWTAVEDALQEGSIRMAGVSIADLASLEKLLNSSNIRIRPSFIQIKLAPLHPSTALVELCGQHEILIRARYPLLTEDITKHPAIVALADKYGKTTTQVLLGSSLQRGHIVLLDQTKLEILRDIADTWNWTLEDEDMETLGNV